MENEHKQEIDSSSVEDQELYMAYFGNDADYYLERLIKVQNGKRFIFNAYAFFLGIFWFAYRKMFLVVGIFLALLALELILVEIFFPYSDTTAYDRLMNIVYATVMGGFANYWYMIAAEKKIEKAKSLFSNQEDRIEYLKQNGGTNIGYAFAVVGILIALIVFLVFVAE